MINLLKLHKDFYKKEAVYEAANKYVKIANIQIDDRGNYLICVFNNYKLDIELIKKEFSNYVIALMVKEKEYMKA